MSKRKLVLIMACLMMIGSLKAANAADEQAKEDQAKADADLEAKKLDQITDLLNALAEAGAIDVTKDGRVVVKKSVTDRLREKGRMNSAPASFSSICSKVAK